MALQLDREPNPAVRLAAVERLGPEHMVAALARPPVARDAAGELYRIGPERQPTLLVKVAETVNEADGRARHHWLPVPPYMATAREAVAWTFGKTEQEYRPTVET